jgi:glutamate dehydrogenase/leucine dehydrogenase
MANAPIEEAAESLLAKRDSVVIPDIIANAGGVIVSYFEWVQNRQGISWTEEDVNARLKETITSAFDTLFDEAEKTNAGFRTTAYQIAIERILKAERLRGTIS